MKQLPGGRGRPRRWLQQLATGFAAVVATIWMVSLLPVLLLVALIAGLLLLPVLRQLRRDLESIEQAQSSNRRPAESLRNATPWHQRLRNHLRRW